MTDITNYIIRLEDSTISWNYYYNTYLLLDRDCKVPTEVGRLHLFLELRNHAKVLLDRDDKLHAGIEGYQQFVKFMAKI